MKIYLCRECDCNFQVHFEDEYPGGVQRCPNCNSVNIKRIEKEPFLKEGFREETDLELRQKVIEG
jgi:hypothetical protein